MPSTRRFVLMMSMMVALVAGMASFVQANTIVRFDTNMGAFDVELFDTATPLSVANFLSYATSGAYDDTMIHRSYAPLPLIQGGGYNLSGQAIPVAGPLPLEAFLPNLRGTIGVARASAPDSGRSQWYINLSDNPVIDGQYAVFGRVIGNGMDVVDAVFALPTFQYQNPFDSVPLRDFTQSDFQSGVNPLPHVVAVNSVTVVPEPSSLALAATGIIGILACARRRLRLGS